MKRYILPTLFLMFSIPLFSLDIWINGEFYDSYDREELIDYAVPDNPLREGSVVVSEIIPLFEDVYRIEAYGGRNSIILEEPENLLRTLKLVFSDGTYYLSRGDNRLENPTRMDIWGRISEETTLTVLLPENDTFTRDRLEEFCRFHNLSFNPLPSAYPAKDLMNRFNQKKEIPHLIVFPEETLPDLEGKTERPRDYGFSIISLFAPKRSNMRPMVLSNILGESSHRYSWNVYDYKTFSLFENYYNSSPDISREALKKALVLNRSLKEMGILHSSADPSRDGADFFIESTSKISLDDYTCYPDFITPLYDYTLIAQPFRDKTSLVAQAAEDYLLSRSVQSIMGWSKTGLYPALNPKEFVNPSDPCLILLNKYGEHGLRLSYSGERLALMENWETLSRLALNSALSIDDLIISSLNETKGVF